MKIIIIIITNKLQNILILFTDTVNITNMFTYLLLVQEFVCVHVWST